MEINNLSELQTRWVALWNRIGFRENPEEQFARLEGSYSEPPRAYHNLVNVHQCLRQLDRVRHLADSAKALELALWFHDSIYDPQRHDNEERSAELAQEILFSKLHSPTAWEKSAQKVIPLLVREVKLLILATKHNAPPQGINASLIVDIDLSILGESVEAYDVFERQIAEEYRFVDKRSFAKGRAAVLRGFLERPYIYNTELFRQRFEANARKNLKCAIALLVT